MSALSQNWSDQLIDSIADRVLQRIQSHLEGTSKIFPKKLTFDEIEAAEILGIPRHVLKGCRERGEIVPAKIGKKWHYTREQLISFAATGAN
jgi:hypothetical protein